MIGKCYDVRKLIEVTFIDERLTFIERDGRKKGRYLHMAMAPNYPISKTGRESCYNYNTNTHCNNHMEEVAFHETVGNQSTKKETDLIICHLYHSSSYIVVCLSFYHLRHLIRHLQRQEQIYNEKAPVFHAKVSLLSSDSISTNYSS